MIQTRYHFLLATLLGLLVANPLKPIHAQETTPEVSRPKRPANVQPDDFQLLTEQEKTRSLEDLQVIWDGYQSDLVTADINYLALIFTLKSRTLSCEEFLEELEQIPLVATDQLTRQLVEQFCPEKLTGTEEEVEATLKAVGNWRTFRQQGRERRSLSPVYEHVLTEDLHLLVDHPNRDVKAHHRGGCPYWFETMGWFRIVPNADLFNDSRVLKSSTGEYRLEFFGPGGKDIPDAHASWLRMDSGDGLPRAWKLISPETGQVLRLELFQDMISFPGDVICPRVRVKANFVDDKVTTVQISVIEDAQFNMGFAEDAFRLSVPEGWAWFDWQLDEHHAGTWTQPVENVAEFFRGRTARESTLELEAAAVPTFSSWRSLLLIFNGSILIVIGIALWRRSS